MTFAELDDLVDDLLSPAQQEAWRACRAPGSMPVREYARTTERSPGTVGNHLSRAEAKLTDALGTEDLDLPLDFLTERDDYTTSWQRAAPLHEDTVIERKGRYGWRVQLPDGSPHTVALGKERGGYVGWCDCKGYEYRDVDTSPCAHLCTLRQAEFIDAEDVDEDRVDIPETQASGDRAIPDGGTVVEYAAGSDGRVFGRPEGQL